MVRAAAHSRTNWSTPEHVFMALHNEFLFDLDGAADPTNAKFDSWLGPGSDICEDAFKYLPAPVRETIWVNPPYGNLMSWVQLFSNWAQCYGATVVALLPANTDTRWFESVWEDADEIRFVKGRIQFVGTTSSNPGGSMVVVYRGHCPVTDSPRVSLVEFSK